MAIETDPASSSPMKSARLRPQKGGSSSWFEVDRRGLRDLVQVRGKSPAWVLHELYQNAADTGATRISVDLNMVEGRRGIACLSVTDNDLNGFSDITHSFTLFAPSVKKSDPTLAGRFNFGEKEVLACCIEATVTTTTGQVRFTEAGGRQESPAPRREAGSQFTGLLRMGKGECEAAITEFRSILPRPGVEVLLNGRQIVAPPALQLIPVTLETIKADPEGRLRPTRRKTTLELREPRLGLLARLYELGIPVQEIALAWDVNVLQKVPLSLERDAVTPSYLASIRVAVANQMSGQVDTETAAQPWAVAALSDSRITPEAVSDLVTARFGKDAFIHDPGDPEATRIAVSEGKTPVYGGALPRAAWENVRRAKALVTAPPSPKADFNDLTGGPDAPSIFIDHAKWTVGMRRLADYSWKVAAAVGLRIEVRFISDLTKRRRFAAMYAPGVLVYNKLQLGNRWIDRPDPVAVDTLLLHELAHDGGKTTVDHLDVRYHDNLSRLGALMVEAERARRLPAAL